MSIKIKESKKGSLHKKLGVAKDKKIPASKLKIKATDSPALKKKKQFALNARKWHEDGGNVDPSQEIIMAFAEKAGIDPNQLIQQLQQMSPEEQQKAIEQMAQQLQGPVPQYEGGGAAGGFDMGGMMGGMMGGGSGGGGMGGGAGMIIEGISGAL